MGVKYKVKMDTRRSFVGQPDDKHSSVGLKVYIFHDSVFKNYKHVVTRRTKQQLGSEQESENERKQRKYTCRVIFVAISF